MVTIINLRHDDTWVNVLRPERRADIDETRREMVRVSVVGYVGLSFTALAALALSSWPLTARLVTIALVVIALVSASLLRSTSSGVPLWLLVLQAPYVLVLISVGAAVAQGDAHVAIAIFYVIVAIYSFHFFITPVALGMLVLGAIAYACAMLFKDANSWLATIVVMGGSGITAGLITNLVVQRISRLAAEDALTGLTNRRSWEALLRHEVLNAPRKNTPLSIVLFDLDNFKHVNDTQGHVAGDRLLQQVAHALQRVTRKGDVAARWGGDEFALLLVNCDRAEAAKIVGRVDEELNELIRFSAGITTWRTSQSLQDMIQDADAELYSVKQEHRRELESASATH